MSESKKTLKPQQELFCQYYTSSSEMFGNGVQSYIEAYDVKLDKAGSYASARVNAHKLLKTDYILERINELLNELVLNDEHVDKQLAFLISQNAELNTKLGAIKEYNALKQRIVKKIEGSLTGDLTVALVEFVGDEPSDN
jgi:phage terminase small subunit